VPPQSTALAARLLRLAEWLGSRRGQLVCVLLGLLLVAPSIGSRFVFDDNTHALMQRDDPGVVGVRGSSLDRFVFVSGDPAENRGMIEEGAILPWWSLDSLKLSFFRPLSSLTHALDERLWPGSAALMHVQNVAWYAALLLVVAAVYRRLIGAPAVLGLALLMYAVDDAHGQTLAWIANRNALLASVFGLLALYTHDRWRRGGELLSAILAPVFLLLGLLGAEFAMGACAYLLAYAVFLDRARPLARLLSLVPYALVVVPWRLVYRSLGYGVSGSDAYVDPTGEPLVFLALLPERMLMLLLGQLGAPGADTAFWKPPGEHWLLFVLALMTLALIGWLAASRLRRDPETRFWALGMLLATVPVSASFSSDRTLLLAGVGAFGLLARLFVDALERVAKGAGLGRLRAVVLGGYAALHLLAAAILCPLRARSLEVAGAALDRADQSLPRDAAVRGKTLIIANAPVDAFVGFLHVMRERTGTPRPAQIYSLASATSRIEITRTSDRVLRVRPEHGYLYTETERFWRGARHPFRLGQRVELAGLTAVIAALGADGRPRAVDFVFDEPLSAERYVWAAWRADRYVPFVPPPPGQSVSFPKEDFVEILLAEALR
jgi:hypothetical protein